MIEYTVQAYGDGSKYWFLNDKLHREDGPAIEWEDGTKKWFLNGQLHREDGPASEWANGTKFWYLNGKLHREDGPAVEYADGDKYWCLNDTWMTEEEHQQQTNPVKELTVAEIEALLGHKVKVVK